MEKVLKNILFWVGTSIINHLGKIWVCWNKDFLEVQVVNSTRHDRERRRLWLNLIQVKSQIGSSPWILFGDLNVVKSTHEK